jgi:putative endonuclease
MPLERTLASAGIAAQSKGRRDMPARLTRIAVRILDRLAEQILPLESIPEHQKTGRCGEEDAYFHLRKLGYVMVARNYRCPHQRGEIDLIAWDKDVLCFIEVKTRTSHDVKPAEAAVNRAKRRELAAVARDYLRHAPPSCQWRFDVVSVYYEQPLAGAKIELFKNAFSLS